MVERWRACASYIDAHVWRFTLNNFEHLAALIQATACCSFGSSAPIRPYATPSDPFAVLQRA